MAFTYTENTEAPGSFVIEKTHPKSKAKFYLGLVRKGPRDSEVERFCSLEEVSRHPFPSTEVAFAVLASDVFCKTKRFSYKIVEVVTSGSDA